MRLTSEMILGATKEVEWLLEPVLPLGIQTTLYGRPGLGKSMLALQWALDIAKNEPVVYLDYEASTRLMEKRALSFERANEFDDNLTYLLGAHGDVGLLDSPEGASNLEELLWKTEAKVLFIDSMAEATGGRENDADTFTAFNHHTGRLLKLNQVSTIRIDHESTKSEGNNGPRGSSRKTDDTELEWHLTAINQHAQAFNLMVGKDRGGFIEDHAPIFYSIGREPSRVSRTGEITLEVATDAEVELHKQFELEGFDLATASRKSLQEHHKKEHGKGLANDTASRLLRQAKNETLDDPF